MEQSESAYEQQRRETISMNERKLAELGLASAPLAPRPAKASRGLPRPPPGERTRVQPRRASTDEGTRPDYGESPPPAARRRLAGSAANGHAAPAAEESRDEEPSAAELTEAASAADELRTGSAPFVLRRAPSGAVVRASVPLKPLGSAARVCCSSAPAVRDSHACLPRARPQATVFIAGGSTATFAMAWQPDGRGVRVFVADAADAVDASPPASVAGERGCDSTLPPRSSSVAFGAAVDGVAVHMDARPMHLLCDKLRHFPTHGVWALAWGLQPPLPRGFPPRRRSPPRRGAMDTARGSSAQS